MKKKAAATANVAGLASSEIWVSETPERVGYTHVIKWESRERFKAWMRDVHSKEHDPKDGRSGPPIAKTACQYEGVDAASL
ncbi:MAG: hypothetical protein LBS82_04325 [Spirochaetaceae bacterium]|nr:hypothetical protein [Spirochaetaceae bacterium]